MITTLRSLFEGLILAKKINRGQERIWRAGITGVTGFLSQGITIALGIISVPLTIGYLGEERYGVWLTINSLLSWLAISKMGFGGNALINGLAEANGRDDKKTAQELVATAFWCLVGISSLLSLIFVLLLPFIPWASLFNVSGLTPQSELKWAVIWAFVIFALTFPMSLVDAVYLSYQKGYIGNMWGIASNILSLVALVAVTRAKGGLPLLVLALSGIRLLVTGSNTLYLFSKEYPWLTPNPQAVTRSSVRRLSSLGLKYLIAQLAGIGMFQSQPLIITQLLGPSQVGIFNVTQRLLTLPQIVIQMFTNPLMPAYGEAQARQDWQWIRQTFRRTIIMSIVASVIMVVPLLFLTDKIIEVWAGPSLVPEPSLVIYLCIYALIAGIVTPASVMLYGLERVSGQAMIAVMNALGTVGVGIWLTKSEGLVGMAMAMAMALICVNLVGQSFQIFTLLNNRRVVEVSP